MSFRVFLQLVRKIENFWRASPSPDFIEELLHAWSLDPYGGDLIVLVRGYDYGYD